MVDLSRKILMFNGYTFKNLRNINLGAPEEIHKKSEKTLSGKRRILYSPDPNVDITVTVPTGTEDELILLNAAEANITGPGFYKDASVDKYKRGVSIEEIAVNKGELANDGEGDSREFTLVCVGVREVMI